MLYAQVKDKSMWPMAWEKCELMGKHLNRITYGYQVEIHAKMFVRNQTRSRVSEYRGVLIKWMPNAVTRDMRREVLLDTDNPEQMEAALFMLINEAEAQAKAHIKMNVSMIP